MRVVVIGATGHVGTYLVPRLVRAGHEVVAVSRGEREPYRPAPEWRAVERVALDREAAEAAGTFGGRIAALGADAVVDMLCFTPASAEQLVAALRQSRPLLVHCGTIWVHGPAARVPVTRGRAADRIRRVRDGQGGRSRPCSSGRRSPAACRASSSTPGTSPGRAGR